MLDLVTAVLSGGATGLLGTAISGVLGFFQSRSERGHEIKLRELDIELAKAEASSAERVAAVDAESEVRQAEWSALEASYRDASSRMSRAHEGGAMKVVDVVRGLIRPLLTVALVAAVIVIFFYVGVPELDAEKMGARIIETVLYLATAAVLWWFGQRQIEKRAVKGLPWLK